MKDGIWRTIIVEEIIEIHVGAKHNFGLKRYPVSHVLEMTLHNSLMSNEQ